MKTVENDLKINNKNIYKAQQFEKFFDKFNNIKWTLNEN